MITAAQLITLVLPEWQYYTTSPIIWQFFYDPDFMNDLDEPVGKTQPPDLKELGCGGGDSSAVAIFFSYTLE